jgi:hypothetical protein
LKLKILHLRTQNCANLSSVRNSITLKTPLRKQEKLWKSVFKTTFHKSQEIATISAANFHSVLQFNKFLNLDNKCDLWLFPNSLNNHVNFPTTSHRKGKNANCRSLHLLHMITNTSTNFNLSNFFLNLKTRLSLCKGEKKSFNEFFTIYTTQPTRLTHSSTVNPFSKEVEKREWYNEISEESLYSCARVKLNHWERKNMRYKLV